MGGSSVHDRNSIDFRLGIQAVFCVSIHIYVYAREYKILQNTPLNQERSFL